MPLDGTLYHNDEILQLLDEAQERIRNPENWCQEALFQTTRDGTRQWCARGAVKSELWYQGVDALLSRAAVEMGHIGTRGLHHAVVALNNTTDHSTVMAMFDLAREMRLSQILEEQKEFAHV